ncbi:hypothetical protein [Alkalinema pantanalense]|uniref:hypothetical protein n=1 Tax=Alkalinema pantanalense TaxID=1620705 RepID=UPI003D6F74F3
MHSILGNSNDNPDRLNIHRSQPVTESLGHWQRWSQATLSMDKFDWLPGYTVERR